MIKNKKKIISLILASIVGVIIVFVSCYYLVLYNSFKNEGSTEAKVIDVISIPSRSDANYDLLYDAYIERLKDYQDQKIISSSSTQAVILQFAVNDEVYVVEGKYFDQQLDIGDAIMIYYQTNDPYDYIYQDYDSTLIVFILIIGAIVIISSCFLIIKTKQTDNIKKEIYTFGTKVKCRIIHSEEVNKKEKKGLLPKIIICSYIEENHEKIFTSEDFYSDYAYQYYVGKYVNVYVYQKDGQEKSYVAYNEIFEK